MTDRKPDEPTETRTEAMPAGAEPVADETLDVATGGGRTGTGRLRVFDGLTHAVPGQDSASTKQTRQTSIVVDL